MTKFEEFEHPDALLQEVAVALDRAEGTEQVRRPATPSEVNQPVTDALDGIVVVELPELDPEDEAANALAAAGLRSPAKPTTDVEITGNFL